MTQEPTLTERKQMTGQVLGVLSIMSSAMSAYHGYRRNQSIGWALWWAMMGGMFPVVTPAIALAQGFGAPRRGLAGLGGIGRPQWVTARYSGPLGLDLVVWSTHKTRATAMEFALRRNRQFGAVNPEEGPFRAYQVGPGAPYEMISVFGKRMLRSVVGSREQHSGLADLGSGYNPYSGRWTMAEADFMGHMTMWGSSGYPIRKVKSGWIWHEAFGVKGAPTVYRTKRDAMAAVEAYMDILRDKAAGRI